MTEAREKILAVVAELGLTMESTFIPFSQSRMKDEKLHSLNWKVRLYRNATPPNSPPRSLVVEIDYTAGQAHAPSYKQQHGGRSLHSVSVQDAIDFECETGKQAVILSGGNIAAFAGKHRQQIKPDICDVLSSLIMDSDCLSYGGFEDWASNLGFDTDSRKAETIWKACIDTALKMRNGLGEDGLAKLAEACQDY
jgi:hypothetical protein